MIKVIDAKINAKKVNTIIKLKKYPQYIKDKFIKRSLIYYLLENKLIDYELDVMSDNICITGTTQTSITIDTVEYTKESLLTPNTGSYVVKFLNDGTFSWINWIDGELEDIVYSMTTDYYKSIYLVGQSNSSSITLNSNSFRINTLNFWVEAFDNLNVFPFI